MNDSGSYLFLETDRDVCQECILFDFDGTLAVKANSDKPYSQETNEHNYVFLYNVENKIRSYINRNYLVIIISNQMYMTKAKENMFLNIYNFFDRRISIYVSNRNNRFRKPDTGFYDLISSNYEIKYYCGDAVGNESDFIPFKYSNVDLSFALNCSIPFYDPLEIFGSNFYTIVPKQQLVILMGIQGSGKTTIAKRLENEDDFVRFSQDECGNLKNKLSEIREELQYNRVVIDATNRKHSLRKQFINLCDDYVILWCVRDGRPFNKLRKKPVHPAGIALYVKEFEIPLENFEIVS